MRDYVYYKPTFRERIEDWLFKPRFPVWVRLLATTLIFGLWMIMQIYLICCFFGGV